MKKTTPPAERPPFAWPSGFQAAGIHAGIKPDKKDLALLTSQTTATVAGTFTTNQVQASPVKLCRERLAGEKMRALIVNSGNANACTGQQGRRDAEATGQQVAEALGLDPGEVFVCSTGPIGVPLPMSTLSRGIPLCVDALRDDGAADFASAIMTTDTFPKIASEQFPIGDQTVTISGIAKGAGMIEPKMATMLAFLVTDAAVDPAALQTALSQAVALSFNRITVDGDRSTNDTVLLFANGTAGHEPLDASHPDWPAFNDALRRVTLSLALDIVRDGEGATKVVTVHVRGARNDEEAEAAARAVANSSLIKTSWAGGQANWGRVMDALGYSRAVVEEECVEIDYDTLPAVRHGIAADTAQVDLDRVVAQDRFTLGIRLNLGEGEAIMYSCDTTEEYVRINVEE